MNAASPLQKEPALTTVAAPDNTATAMPPPVSFTTLACPPMDAPVLNMHPRVFLTPDAHSNASCPYCGAHYSLTETAASSAPCTNACPGCTCGKDT